MTSCIFLNGKKLNKKNLPDVSKYKKIICVDGAYNYLKSYGIKPNFVSGDFDSINTSLREVPFISFPNQRATDFEKTLQYLKKKTESTSYHIFGGGGGQLDHFLGNLSAAKMFSEVFYLYFFEKDYYYFISKKSVFATLPIGSLISVFPFPKVEDITYKGLKYPLKNASLEIASKTGIRNETISEQIHITFQKGCIIIFIYQPMKDAIKALLKESGK